MNFTTLFKKTSNAMPALCVSVAVAIGLVTAPPASASPREQAKRMHDRLAGVPPTDAVLAQMEASIAAGDDIAAALTAMENSAFYSVTLKNFATPWTNEEQTVFAPLNDYTATVVGMIRDDLDFRGVLSDNIVYVGQGVSPAYSVSNNAHYEAMGNTNADLQSVLVRRTQTEVYGLPENATAGVMTTRAGARAFYYAGTNRAMFRFTLMNHLCYDLEQVKDTTRAPDRIRQDVSRSPGGDSRIFLNACVGCHAGMDPLAQAFAYYEWQYDRDADPEGDAGQLIYNSGADPENPDNIANPALGSRVQEKYLINDTTFKWGFRTPDDQWDNYWREGPNAERLGWDPALPGSGEGAKSFGQELAHSEAFAQCQVKKVFKTVCLRDPQDSTDRGQIQSMVSSFKNSGYRMKQVFAEAASYCKGE